MGRFVEAYIKFCAGRRVEPFYGFIDGHDRGAMAADVDFVPQEHWTFVVRGMRAATEGEYRVLRLHHGVNRGDTRPPKRSQRLVPYATLARTSAPAALDAATLGHVAAGLVSLLRCSTATLEECSVRGLPLGPAAQRLADPLGLCVRLRRLCLDDTALGDAAASSVLAAALQCPRLEEVSLCGCALSGDVAPAVVKLLQGTVSSALWQDTLRGDAAPAGASALRCVALARNGIDDRGAALVAGALADSGVTALVLSGNPVAKVASLDGAARSELTYLELHDTPLSAAPHSAVGGLPVLQGAPHGPLPRGQLIASGGVAVAQGRRAPTHARPPIDGSDAPEARLYHEIPPPQIEAITQPMPPPLHAGWQAGSMPMGAVGPLPGAALHTPHPAVNPAPPHVAAPGAPGLYPGMMPGWPGWGPFPFPYPFPAGHAPAMEKHHPPAVPHAPGHPHDRSHPSPARRASLERPPSPSASHHSAPPEGDPVTLEALEETESEGSEDDPAAVATEAVQAVGLHMEDLVAAVQLQNAKDAERMQAIVLKQEQALEALQREVQELRAKPGPAPPSVVVVGDDVLDDGRAQTAQRLEGAIGNAIEQVEKHLCVKPKAAAAPLADTSNVNAAAERSTESKADAAAARSRLAKLGW